MLIVTSDTILRFDAPLNNDIPSRVSISISMPNASDQELVDPRIGAGS